MLKKELVTNLIFREICRGNIPRISAQPEGRRKHNFVKTVLLISTFADASASNVSVKKMQNQDLV
jgi:hypothetical protein